MQWGRSLHVMVCWWKVDYFPWLYYKGDQHLYTLLRIYFYPGLRQTEFELQETRLPFIN